MVRLTASATPAVTRNGLRGRIARCGILGGRGEWLRRGNCDGGQYQPIQVRRRSGTGRLTGNHHLRRPLLPAPLARWNPMAEKVASMQSAS
jgi:hypothetical protein